jgi:hypothetical protein
MPETMHRVEEILERLHGNGLRQVTLLVVPGRNWQPVQLETLHAWQHHGHILAGHGWVHECNAITSAFHRLHSAVLSRNVAEHLSLDGPGVCDLLARNHAWFIENGLEAPNLYVPPAWAMGSATRADLQAAPFRYYEVLSGVYDSEADVFHRLPLTGYEADTVGRAIMLRLLNGVNLTWARRSGKPLRIGIHPFDYGYRIAGDIDRHLRAAGDRRLYPALSA